MELVALSNPETEEQKISLDQPVETKRPEHGIKERVAEAKFADPEMDEAGLDFAFRNNQEQGVQDLFANKAEAREDQARHALVDELASENPTGAAEVVEGLSLRQPRREEAIAKEYGKQVTNTIATNSETVQDALQDDPERTLDGMDVMEEYAAKTSIIRDIIQKAENKFNEKSLLGQAASVGATFIPFASWIARNDAVETAPTVSWLPGNNVTEQISYIWSLPVEDIGPTLQEAIDDISSFSDFEAMIFAQAFMTYSSSDEFLDNVFAGAEAVGVVPVAKIATMGKNTGKALMKNGPDSTKVLESVGDTERAAVQVVANQDDTIERVLPSLMDIDSVIQDSEKLSSAAVRKLKEQATFRAVEGQRLLENNIDIDSLNDIERAALAEAEFQHIREVHPGVKDAIVDTKIIEAQNTADNVDKIQVSFGKQDGSLFKSELAAKSWASRYLQFKDAKIVHHGEGYSIQVQKNIKQGDRLDGIKLTSDAVTPDRWAWTRALQGDAAKLSLQQAKDRRTVSDLSELLGRTVETLAAPLGRISGKRRTELEDTLTSIRDTIHSDGKRKWLSLGEFEDEFIRINGKNPTEDQADAYLATRQISDLDYAMRDLTLMKQKSRMGVENWQVLGAADTFEGIAVDSVPFGSAHYFRVVALDDTGKVLKKGNNRSPQKLQQEINNLIAEGYTVIKPFSGFLKVGEEASENATFIVSRTGKRSSLKFGQSVGYNPGGHLISKYPFYLKQASIQTNASGRRMYTGDNTLWNIMTEKQGAEIAEHFNNAVDLKRAGNDAAFNKYIRDNLPELSAKDLKRIDFNTKVAVVRSGSRSVDTGFYKKGVDFDEDITGNPFSESSKLNGRFLGERDDQIADAIISEHKGPIRTETAKVIKPIDALQVGMRDAFNQRVFTDYAAKSADRFLREFDDILSDSVRRNQNPIALLGNLEFKDGVPPEAISKAQAAANAINQFLGTPTTTSRYITRAKEKVIQSALNRFGEDSKAFKIVDERLLHTVNDPATFFRSVAFHTKLGLFNAKQLFLQSQAVVHAASIGGLKDAGMSIPAIAYTHGLRLTAKPGMLDEAAKRMQKFGWKPEEFKEAHTALLDSGWDIVGGSSSWRDMYEGPSLVNGRVQKFLDAGTSFFRKGEQFGRTTAWFTSYRNWRAANPGKAFDRQAIEQVRIRASDMTSNMTRDMNAAWQRGFASVPTQFWGFQARVFEQLWAPSSRLTAIERLRLFSGISLFYGIPVGMGAASAVWPVNESVKKYMMEEGLDEQVEGNPFAEALRDGIISTGIEMATGMDFDTANFGASGLPVLKDLIRGDAEWYETFGGASAGIILDMTTNAMPFMQGVYYAATDGTPETDPFVLSVEDLFEAGKVISTVNNATKLYKALETGKWISSNETVLGDISQMEAFTSAITGLELERFTDTFLKLESAADVKAYKKKAIKEVQKGYGRARRALDRGDIDEFSKHMKRAKALGKVSGLTERELQRTFSQGFTPQNLDEAAEERFNDYVLKHKERQRQGNEE